MVLYLYGIYGPLINFEVKIPPPFRPPFFPWLWIRASFGRVVQLSVEARRRAAARGRAKGRVRGHYLVTWRHGHYETWANWFLWFLCRLLIGIDWYDPMYLYQPTWLASNIKQAYVQRRPNQSNHLANWKTNGPPCCLTQGFSPRIFNIQIHGSLCMMIDWCSWLLA